MSIKDVIKQQRPQVVSFFSAMIQAINWIDLVVLASDLIDANKKSEEEIADILYVLMDEAFAFDKAGFPIAELISDKILEKFFHLQAKRVIRKARRKLK
jgi:hypothetical protein